MHELNKLITEAKLAGRTIVEVQMPFTEYQKSYEPYKLNFSKPTEQIVGLLYGYNLRDSKNTAVITL